MLNQKYYDKMKKEEEERAKRDREYQMNILKQTVAKRKARATIWCCAYPFTIAIFHMIIHPIFCFININKGGYALKNHICDYVEDIILCSIDFGFSTAVILAFTYPIGVWIALFVFCPFFYNIIEESSVTSDGQLRELKKDGSSASSIASAIMGLFIGRKR